MKITRTVNADKRYYVDESAVINPKSVMDTISKFNDMKIQLYNALYDKKYLEKGFLMEKTYSTWLKETFGTNDYYNCAIYTYASGMISSQKELKNLYLKTKENDIKARDEKIKSMQQVLDKKREIKESIRVYAKTGRWKNPYPGCRMKISGKQVILPCGKRGRLEEYERKLEDEIRDLKTRLTLIKEARKCAEAKRDALKNHNPPRIIFGTRKRYQEKDRPNTDIVRWKTEFYDARYASMSLPGRHTSKNCNFLVRKNGNNLIVKCMDGKETVFCDFKPARYGDVWDNMLKAPKNERKAICYNFNMRKDHKGRKYILVSITLELENHQCNEYFGDGCISIDLNYDHVAVSEIDKDGKRVGGEIFRFHPEGRTSGQISEDIGRMMAKVGRYCIEKKKPLIMEDIDTTISKHGLRYANAKRNVRASVFAYRKMTACMENQAYKHGFGILKINPAYTSQMGKFLYMRSLGISIHEAASYTIGLKGMNRIDRLMPDQRLIELLPQKEKNAMKKQPDIFALMNAWKKISDAFSEVKIHSFFREIPYYAFESSQNKSKKCKNFKMLSDEMKTWTRFV